MNEKERKERKKENPPNRLRDALRSEAELLIRLELLASESESLIERHDRVMEQYACIRREIRKLRETRDTEKTGRTVVIPEIQYIH